MSRALVINPHEASRFSARLALERLGFEVSLVGNGGDAFAQLLRWQPTLVLIDGASEQGDPFSLMATISAFSSASRPCLIFTAARAAGMMVNEALQAGADDYLIGSFRPELLRFKLAQARARGRLRGNIPVINHLRKVV